MMPAREREMRPAVTAWLASSGHAVVYEVCVYACGYICDVVGARFGERTGRAIPPVDSCIAVELKLSDVAEVIRQAKHNQEGAGKSYAAMPAAFADRMRPRTLDKFRNVGVGLLSVDVESGEVREVIEPAQGVGVISESLRKKMWRRRAECMEVAAA